MKRTVIVKGSSLKAGHVIVGRTGALIPVQQVSKSSSPGRLVMETEYGPMHFSPDENFQVIDAMEEVADDSPVMEVFPENDEIGKERFSGLFITFASLPSGNTPLRDGFVSLM